MQLRPEVEEISEDLKASQALFAGQRVIVSALENIITYLEEAGDEYVKSHAFVTSGYQAGRQLCDTINEKKMVWVHDFIEGGENYKSRYECNLTNAKGAMRRQVYGA
jgi:hypothetical protein